MSLQLSSGALERLVAHRRTFPLHARTGAVRTLFGPVDHDELSRDMRTRLREIRDRDRQRWNFNFEASAPLPGGDYEWEESASESSPVFYRDSAPVHTPGRTRALGVVVTPVDAVDASFVDVPPGCAERLMAGPAESSVCPAAGNRDNPQEDCPAGNRGNPQEDCPLGNLEDPEVCPAAGNRENPQEDCPAGNRENRADSRLNSGSQTRRLQAPCLRRKRSAVTDTNNTHITDFFMKRKKSTETHVNKNETSSCHQSPVAQTTRKRIR